MSRAVRDAVASRIESAVGAARTVYRGNPPKTAAGSFIVVRSTTGVAEARNVADVTDACDVVLWVTSVGSHSDPSTAENEAMWGAEKAHAALDNWRPTIGQGRVRPTSLSAQPPQRDDDRPDLTVSYVVEQWGITYQP